MWFVSELVMVKAIVVPTHLLQPIRLQELDPHDLDAYRQIVGGNLATVNFIEPAAGVYFHDEGKLFELPLNLRLTTLLWMHNSLLRNEDAIMGPGLIVGPPNEHGDDQDAPQDLVALLFHTKRYLVQIKTTTAKEWHTGIDTFTVWTDAYRYALAFALRCTVVTAVRVIPELAPELRDVWFHLGLGTAPIHDAVDPPFTRDSFVGCFSVAELEERFEHGNWALGTAFYYRDLCFICRVDGGDEWLTIRHGVAFETMSLHPVIEAGEFSSLVARLLAATREQCLRLEY